MSSVNTENVSDKNTIVHSDCIDEIKNNNVTDLRDQSEVEAVPENSVSQTTLTEDVQGPSDESSSSQSNECVISIPDTMITRQKPDRYIGVIKATSLVPGVYKPDDFCLVSGDQIPIPPRGNGRDEVRDVTLNLTEFLSFAQRNNYNIVIPPSRDVCTVYPSVSTTIPRMDSGCGYMVLHRQANHQNFNAASTYGAEFIGLSTPSRNSVLAPNMYPSSEEIQPPAVDFSAPPPYEMPLKLPTYEEVQREKAREGEPLPPNIVSCHDPQTMNPTSPRTLSFLAIDSDVGPISDTESKLLGTDFMFAVAFFLALIFNWIGFLLLMCFCHTVAARYGALSGFGLSLAKWTIIVKNSKEVPVQSAWLWWLITAFGLLICIRSLFQYINIKRGWRLMSSATQERLLFFY